MVATDGSHEHQRPLDSEGEVVLEALRPLDVTETPLVELMARVQECQEAIDDGGGITLDRGRDTSTERGFSTNPIRRADDTATPRQSNATSNRCWKSYGVANLSSVLESIALVTTSTTLSARLSSTS